MTKNTVNKQLIDNKILSEMWLQLKSNELNTYLTKKSH